MSSSPAHGRSPADRKQQTHERILDVASRAVRRGGYQGVGVADIMKAAGLTHGGFYAHFASRDALLVEAIDWTGRHNTSSLRARMAQLQGQGASPFEALVTAYLGEAHLANPEQGCVVAALASENPRQSAEVQAAAARRARALVTGVRTALPEGVPAAQAQVIAATLVGALQLARTLGGDEARALLAQTREALLQAHPPVAAAAAAAPATTDTPPATAP